jgi:hypothetical protein
MKKLRLLVVFISLSTIAFAQIEIKKNSIYIELGGNGFLGSINYERQITKSPGLGFRLGIGTYTANPFQLTIPIGINYLFELNNKISFLDLGFGVTYTKADVLLYISVKYADPNYVNTNYINYIPSVGYRRQIKNNFMWRISFTPVVNHIGFIPFFGFSFGKDF